jgi:hypothetical protein
MLPFKVSCQLTAIIYSMIILYNNLQSIAIFFEQQFSDNLLVLCQFGNVSAHRPKLKPTAGARIIAIEFGNSVLVAFGAFYSP